MSSIKAINQHRILSVWLGALILCAPALLNNFPFLYADTGTYLSCGFHGTVSDIRPVTYALFIRHVSLMESLWLVILVQALIVSWSIHTFFRACSEKPVGIRPLAAILILTLTTGIGEVTGMLMPDFFTAVMILCGAILLFGKNIVRWRFALTSLLFWLAVASHHSNAYIFFFLLLTLLLLWIIRRWKRQTGAISLRGLVLTLGLALAGYFTIPVLHWTYSGEFFWSKAKSVFLTNRVNQMGLLKPFLQENCGSHDYRLCAYKDELPNEFLWDPNSPLAKTGGWAANDAEYGRMLGDFFRQPRYAKKFFIKTLENGFMQFFTFEGKVIFKEREEGYPFQVMRDVLPEFIPSIQRSLQYQDQWSSNFTNTLQRFLVFGSFLLLIYIFIFNAKVDQTAVQASLAGYICLALLANALVCSGISMVDMRFQYRVIWLLPLFTIWLAGELNLYERISRRRYSDQDKA